MISQENPPINKPKMAYSRDLSKMAIMDYQGTLGTCSGQPPPHFSRKSYSRIANIRLSVHQSVTKTPQPLRIAPIDKPINHRAYQPSSLLTIEPIDNQAY